MKRTSSPESRAAQARLAAADREAEHARVIAADFALMADAGAAPFERYEGALARFRRLAGTAEQLRRTWLAEAYIARVAAAVGDRPDLDPDQRERLAAVLREAGIC